MKVHSKNLHSEQASSPTLDANFDDTDENKADIPKSIENASNENSNKEMLNLVQKHSVALDEEELELIRSAKLVNGRLQCPICPRTLSQRKILRLHIRAHVGKNLLHCKLCGKGFAKVKANNYEEECIFIHFFFCRDRI